MPFRPDNFWIVAAAPAVGIVLIAWLSLAALRSRATDPQRYRRQARAQQQGRPEEARRGEAEARAVGTALVLLSSPAE